jgi:hypothetical protein
MMTLRVCDDVFGVRNIAQAARIASDVRESYREFGGPIYSLDGIDVTLEELAALTPFAKVESVDAVPFLAGRRQAKAELMLESYYNRERKVSPIFSQVEKVATGPAPAPSPELRSKIDRINKWIGTCGISVQMEREPYSDVISDEMREDMKTKLPNGPIGDARRAQEARANVAKVTGLEFELV